MYRRFLQLSGSDALSADILCQKASLLLVLAFMLLGISPATQAVLPPPPPDGGYPNFNTAEGSGALFQLTTGHDNTAVGFEALFSNTRGINNTAVGSSALLHSTEGDLNTATGFEALASNTIGVQNTAIGANALQSNISGAYNTAVGRLALMSSDDASFNTAIGVYALQSDKASANTATGFEALFRNTSGSNNTAAGVVALQNNTTGHDNIAMGFEALANNMAGSFNIALGSNAGINLTTGSNNIDIGAAGVAAEANTIRIGKSGTQKKTFIAGIRGTTVASGVGVIVGSTGQLGTVVSSARFKEAIKPMDKASEAILALKPVKFRYKEEVDPDATPQFGLVAEEVEKVNPQLVVHDEQGKPFTVRYDAVNAMLLNEFLKEHRKVEELNAAAAKQGAKIEQQQKQIEALAAAVRKSASESR